MSNAIDNQLDEISKKITDKEIEEAFKGAEAFALIPILKLIYHTTQIDYSKEFKIKIPFSSKKANLIPIGEIEINETEFNKLTVNEQNENISVSYKLYLDLVDSTYDLNQTLIDNNLLSPEILSLNDEPNDKKKDQLIQIITFLTHSAKLIFDSLKNKYSELLKYEITLDQNTSIYLDHKKPLRLGLNIKKTYLT
jgi:hypothetical protein